MEDQLKVKIYYILGISIDHLFRKDIQKKIINY